MKKSHSDLSRTTTASHDSDAPFVLPLEMPGLDLAALPRSSSTSSMVHPPELLDWAYIKDYKVKHPCGPSRNIDDDLELSYSPKVLPDSCTITVEAQTNMSIHDEAVSASRQPGAEHVNGILQTTLSAHNVDDGDANLHSERQGERTHHLVATLVEPAPIAEIISDSELQAAYQPSDNGRNCRMLLWIGGPILLVIIVISIAVKLTGSEPDPSSQILKALNPVLPSSSKEAITVVDTAQYEAFQWLKRRAGVRSLSDDQIRQLYALATLYHATSGDQWDRQSGWLTTDDECNWYFSDTNYPYTNYPYMNLSSTNICLNGVLMHVDLNTNNLNGVLPPDIVILSNLTFLSLSVSALTGDPSFLAQLSNLEYLDLSQIGLTGAIPTFFAQLTNLKALGLASNALTGTIPPELGQLTMLEFVSFSQVGLTGTLPSLLGQLTSLKGLDLSSNKLNGTIPSSFGQLTSLVAWSLRNNTLSGTIPSSIGQLTSLGHLGLDSNALTGTFPSFLGQLTSLFSLRMHFNALNGTIPSRVCDIVNLTELYIDCDKVTCGCGLGICECG